VILPCCMKLLLKLPEIFYTFFTIVAYIGDVTVKNIRCLQAMKGCPASLRYESLERCCLSE
jgi:hypothetical protein